MKKIKTYLIIILSIVFTMLVYKSIFLITRFYFDKRIIDRTDICIQNKVAESILNKVPIDIESENRKCYETDREQKILNISGNPILYWFASIILGTMFGFLISNKLK